MIDRDTFDDAFAMLEDRFKRDHGQETRAMYYRILSDELTTDQFQLAARKLFRSATYFPKPDDFVKAVGGDQEQRALEDWETVQDVFLNLADKNDLSPEGRRTIKLLGGWGQVGRTKKSNLPHVREDFMEMYGTAARMESDDHPDQLPPEDSRAEDLLEEATGGVALPDSDG